MALLWPQVRYGLELPGLPRTSRTAFLRIRHEYAGFLMMLAINVTLVIMPGICLAVMPTRIAPSAKETRISDSDL